ncbi:MAG: hypothetical protein ACO3K7_00780 [Candidatus Marinamargulisbacteria bacterium]
MKKYLLMLLATTVLFSVPTLSANNAVRVGVGLPRPIVFEYERKLNNIFPNLSAFVNYGSGTFEFEETSTTLSGLGVGARYKLPFIGYVGVGYGTFNTEYSYIASETVGSIQASAKVTVDADFSGLIFEYGKEFGLGPVLLGGKVNYLVASPKISAKADDTEVQDIDDVQEGMAELKGIPGAEIYVGIAF